MTWEARSSIKANQLNIINEYMNLISITRNKRKYIYHRNKIVQKRLNVR